MQVFAACVLTSFSDCPRPGTLLKIVGLGALRAFTKKFHHPFLDYFGSAKWRCSVSVSVSVPVPVSVCVCVCVCVGVGVGVCVFVCLCVYIRRCGVEFQVTEYVVCPQPRVSHGRVRDEAASALCGSMLPHHTSSQSSIRISGAFGVSRPRTLSLFFSLTQSIPNRFANGADPLSDSRLSITNTPAIHHI